MDRIEAIPLKLTAGVSPELDLEGKILLGVFIDVELTSTFFNISNRVAAEGVFTDLKDPTGRYGSTGVAVPFTVGSTSIGTHSIPPELAACLSRVKFTFDQNTDVATVYALIKNI